MTDALKIQVLRPEFVKKFHDMTRDMKMDPGILGADAIRLMRKRFALFRDSGLPDSYWEPLVRTAGETRGTKP
jgi:hypothetical protein